MPAEHLSMAATVLASEAAGSWQLHTLPLYVCDTLRCYCSCMLYCRHCVITCPVVLQSGPGSTLEQQHPLRQQRSHSTAAAVADQQDKRARRESIQAAVQLDLTQPLDECKPPE